MRKLLVFLLFALAPATAVARPEALASSATTKAAAALRSKIEALVPGTAKVRVLDAENRTRDHLDEAALGGAVRSELARSARIACVDSASDLETEWTVRARIRSLAARRGGKGTRVEHIFATLDLVTKSDEIVATVVGEEARRGGELVDLETSAEFLREAWAHELGPFDLRDAVGAFRAKVEALDPKVARVAAGELSNRSSDHFDVDLLGDLAREALLDARKGAVVGGSGPRLGGSIASKTLRSAESVSRTYEVTLEVEKLISVTRTYEK
jgi:hypothetical protein